MDGCYLMTIGSCTPILTSRQILVGWRDGNPVTTAMKFSITFGSNLFMVRHRVVAVVIGLDAVRLRHIPLRRGDTDDGNIELAALGHRIERAEYFLVYEVAGYAEQRQRAGSLFVAIGQVHIG